MKSLFEQLHHKSISEEIVEAMVSQIHSGALKGGQKLPPERELSEKMGVSRTSLREALHTLEGMGYIRSTGGGGNYVNTITVEQALTPFSAMMSQDKLFAADIIEVRQHIEVHMATLAARNATGDQLSRIYTAIVNMQAEVEQGGAGLIWDNIFHLEVAKASNNRAFAVILELCSELLSESRRTTLSIPGQPAKTIEDHKAIFQAISDRDEQKAAEEMSKHLMKARFNITKT